MSSLQDGVTAIANRLHIDLQIQEESVDEFEKEIQDLRRNLVKVNQKIEKLSRESETMTEKIAEKEKLLEMRMTQLIKTKEHSTACNSSTCKDQLFSSYGCSARGSVASSPSPSPSNTLFYNFNIDTNNVNEDKCLQVKSFGSGYFFGCQESNHLITQEITGMRIGPTDCDAKLPSMSKSGPLFCECRNYFEIPNQMKGVLVAIVIPEDPKKWQLGLANWINNISQTVELLIWKGQTVLYQQKIYPSFYFHSLGQLCSTTLDTDYLQFIWQLHFSLVNIDLDLVCDFQQLNQVDGKAPEILVHLKSRINPHDNKFEQSILGADVYVLPVSSQMVFPSIPFCNQPFFSSFDSNCPLPDCFIRLSKLKQS